MSFCEQTCIEFFFDKTVLVAIAIEGAKDIHTKHLKLN